MLVILPYILFVVVISVVSFSVASKLANIKCGCCGRKIGMNRYKQGKTISGKTIWACSECVKNNKGRNITIDTTTGEIRVLSAKESEVRVKCNTCGFIYCYNGEDLLRNKQLANDARLNGFLGAVEAFGGTRIGAQIANNTADAKLNQIVDYSRCPKCKSSDVKIISEAELEREREQAKNINTTYSAADELKKYKDLLDAGAITQEEYDVKKKQLLNM